MSHRILSFPFAVLALLLTALAAPAAAQSVNDGYAPNFTVNFTPYTDSFGIQAIAMQPDGKTLLGGAFLDPAFPDWCNRLCRRLADGSVDDTFKIEPAVNDSVKVIRVLADGKILIGGKFTSVRGQTRHHLARLNADGSLDPGFYDPGVESQLDGPEPVVALAVQADGKILVGGFFTSIAGQAYNRIVRLNPNGTLDASFANPNVGSANGISPGTVTALLVQPDGKILIGGWFNSVGGQARSNFARLNADGSLDTSFDLETSPATPSQIHDVEVLLAQPDGKVWIGGRFTSFGGQPRTSLARLNADGGLDATFIGSDVTYSVRLLTLQADGKLLIEGSFFGTDGHAYAGIRRLNLDGSFDANFANTYPDGRVEALAVQPDGRVIVGGDFTEIASTTHLYAARLNTDGSLDATLPDLAPIYSSFHALAAQPDGKMLVGGYFTQFDGQPRHGAARLNADGRLDTSFADPGIDDDVAALAVQADGKVLVGGDFNQVGAQLRRGMVRLNADGSLDTDFADPAPNAMTRGFAVQADGKILASGEFSQIGGQARAGLARLNEDGSLDADFADAEANARIIAMALQADGKILVGGEFTQIAGQTRHYLARLSTDGSLDADFVETDADAGVLALAVQPDGKILVSGGFTRIDGQARHYLARLNADGSLDEGFADTNADFWVMSLAVLADGRILVGGGFSQIGGQTRNHLARLNADGSLDATFDYISMTGGVVYALAAQADGKILLGGNFSKVQGQTRNGLARLSVPDAVLQSLNLQGDTVTWNRAGVAQELALPPILQASTDCITYADLGPMTRIAGGWRRSGVAPPFGSSCLRAVAPVSGSSFSGTQGLIDSVRRIWRDDRLFANGFD